jgi:hypothetical protein
MSTLEKFLPSRPEKTSVPLKLEVEVREMMNALADELGTNRSALVAALVRREYAATFED